MNVQLTQELEQFVQTKIESGRYNSADEVLQEALLIMVEKEEMRAAQLQQLRRKIDMGLAQAEAGDCVDGELFMQRLIDSLDGSGLGFKVG